MPDTLVMPTTADHKPFILGQSLWKVDIGPIWIPKDESPRELPTDAARCRISQGGHVCTTQDVFPGDEQLAVISDCYSTEQAANEAYIEKLKASRQELDAEINWAKSRRLKRTWSVWVNMFDSDRRSFYKRFLYMGEGASIRDVCDKLAVDNSGFRSGYDRDAMTFASGDIIGEEIET